MKIIYKNIIDDKHKSHYWYGGECVRMESNGYIVVIEATGDVNSEYVPDKDTVVHINDKNNAGVFYSEMRDYLKDDIELYKAIEKEELIFDSNNWWEAYIIDTKGTRHDLMWVLNSNYLDEAIEEVNKDFDKMINYVQGIGIVQL